MNIRLSEKKNHNSVHTTNSDRGDNNESGFSFLYKLVSKLKNTPGYIGLLC